MRKVRTPTRAGAGRIHKMIYVLSLDIAALINGDYYYSLRSLVCFVLFFPLSLLEAPSNLIFRELSISNKILILVFVADSGWLPVALGVCSVFSFFQGLLCDIHEAFPVP